VEVVQEFAHVRARTRPRRDAARLARSYAVLFAPLLPVEADDLLAGLTLFERTTTLGPFDSVLAATALRRGADGLVSADTGFARAQGLRHFDPADPEFTVHLRADH
jgi:predicted nucleic acid-binding protein